MLTEDQQHYIDCKIENCPRCADMREELAEGKEAKLQIECALCLDPSHLPSHNGSKYCESGSIASGGTKSHCTCDWCF